MLKFGAIMQACRERAGLTQEEMAARLNRTQSCISKYEKDHKVPDMPTMMQWVEATGAKEVLIAFLYGLDGLSIMQDLMRLVGG